MTKDQMIAAIIKEFEEVYHSTSQNTCNELQAFCSKLSSFSDEELKEQLDFSLGYLTNEDWMEDGISFIYRKS